MRVGSAARVLALPLILGGAAAAVAAPPDPAEPPAPATSPPPGVLTLEQAVALALQGNWT